MSLVHAKQLIYTRVEPSYSPQRKTGYQTVYKSESFSNLLVKEIEERIQCFIPKEPTVRWQYFMADPDTVVLTRTTLVRSHPEITDSDARSGAFLVHCLVLSRSEFARVHNNPFTVFNNYHDFLEDAEVMVKHFGRATGVANDVEIEIKPSKAGVLSSWPKDGLLKLVALGIQASAMVKKKESILLFGESEEIRDTLQLLFALLPGSARLNCSFDTFIERCTYPRGLYWAVGATTTQSANYYLAVDTGRRRIVESGAVPEMAGDGLYLRWLTHKITNQEIANATEMAESIERLSVAFEAGNPIPTTSIQERAAKDFFTFHRDLIQQHVQDALAASLGKGLANPLFDYVWKRIGKLGMLDVLNVASTKNWEPDPLSRYVLDWMEETKPELTEKDLDKLKELARAAGNMRLLLLAALSGKKVDQEARNEALVKMDRDTYGLVLRQYLFHPAEPVDLVTSAYMTLLLAAPQLDRMTEQQFIELVQAIFERGAEGHLRPLAPGVQKLDSDSLIQIEKLLKKRTRVDPEFQRSVSVRRAKLGEPSFMKRLRHRL